MVVFVHQYIYAPDASSVSDGVVHCVEAEIRARNTRLRLVPYDEFRRLAFPGMQPESAPRDPEYLQMLLDDPQFRTRIKPLGLTSIIFVGGATSQVVDQGASGFFVGGCCEAGLLLVYVQWDKATHLGATILNLAAPDATHRVEATATGKPWLLVVELVPMGLPSDTESRACHLLGQRLAADLAGSQSRPAS
jgi:hypothetical protein